MHCAAKQQSLAIIDELTDLRPHATPNLCNGMAFQELQQSEQVVRYGCDYLLVVCL